MQNCQIEQKEDPLDYKKRIKDSPLHLLPAYKKVEQIDECDTEHPDQIRDLDHK